MTTEIWDYQPIMTGERFDKGIEDAPAVREAVQQHERLPLSHYLIVELDPVQADRLAFRGILTGASDGRQDGAEHNNQ